MHREPDEHLVERIAQRDESALIELHNRYAHQLVAFIGRVLSDPDEVMQSALDTFAYVWHHAGQFDPAKLSARAWLVTLAQRTALNRSRGTDLSVTPVQSWNVPARRSAENVEAGGSEGVAGLSAAARDYLELAFCRGYSQRQVSEATGAPLDDVQAEMRQALQKLRAEPRGGKP